ncbi:hypothetical protein DEG01_002200 [Xanthomonas vasicola]|nr:hypothetical protein DEG01_002200 [Xanthomonas vasicola]
MSICRWRSRACLADASCDLYPPSTKHQATSNKQQATSNKQQATSNKQQWTSCQLGLLTLRQWLASPLDSATTCEDGRTENAGFRAVLCNSCISWVRCGLIQQ